MIKRISASEVEFITQGCEDNIRSDGREVFDFRPISIENNVLPHVHGSSRVRIGSSMSILCSVRVAVVECPENRQLLEINAKISPSNVYKSDDMRINDFEVIVAQRLYDTIANSNVIDFSKLCIIPGKFQWAVTVELCILNMDNDPTDGCSIALRAALQCTKLPSHSLLKGESGLDEDFEISSHVADSYAIPLVNEIPICITCHKVSWMCQFCRYLSDVMCVTLLCRCVVDWQGVCDGL
jgi:exosome complex component RRP42